MAGNSSISSLENCIDRAYDELSNTNTNTTKPHMPYDDNVDTENAIFSDSIESNMSTPLLRSKSNVDKQRSEVCSDVYSTPAQSGLFSDILGAFNKKRKTISPIFGLNDENDEINKIAEAVYNVVVGDVSKWLHEQASKFAVLESDLIGKIETELMKDAVEENTASDIRTLQEEMSRLNDLLKCDAII